MNPVHQQAISAIGLVGIMATESVISDIKTMLKNEQKYSLDGYVLALSRLMKHVVAWECISKAFFESKQEIPEKYYDLFQMQKTSTGVTVT